MPKEQELGYLPIQGAQHHLITDLKYGRLDMVIQRTLVECKVQELEYSPAEPVINQVIALTLGHGQMCHDGTILSKWGRLWWNLCAEYGRVEIC